MMDRAEDGARFATCERCGATSDPEPTAGRAREAIARAGWSRVYHGAGEAFRCPSCRSYAVGARAEARRLAAGLAADWLEPNLILEDEKLAGLDAPQRLLIEEELRSLIATLRARSD